MEVSTSLLSIKEDAVRIFYDLEVAGTNYYHIDVMDGKFVERNNMELMKDYALAISHISNVGLDVHFMVENVEEMVSEFLMLNPKIITFHIEATKDKERTMDIINDLKENGIKVGIAISPGTSIEEIKEYIKEWSYFQTNKKRKSKCLWNSKKMPSMSKKVF